MSIVGNIECNGPAQVFGRIKGELRASDLLIGDGAQIEGSVIAQDVTVCGRVKGTIRAVRVKLQDGGAVEGDIFHRSLSIEENSLFEGSSRRVENPTDLPSVEAKGPQEEDMQNSALAPYLQRVEASADAYPGRCLAVAPPEGCARHLCKVDLLTAGSAVTFGKTGQRT